MEIKIRRCHHRDGGRREWVGWRGPRSMWGQQPGPGPEEHRQQEGLAQEEPEGRGGARGQGRGQRSREEPEGRGGARGQGRSQRAGEEVKGSGGKPQTFREGQLPGARGGGTGHLCQDAARSGQRSRKGSDALTCGGVICP